jgi:hypothetical protein
MSTASELEIEVDPLRRLLHEEPDVGLVGGH